MFEPLIIIVSKNEVLCGDISPALSTLNKLMESPEMAKSYREKVHILFDGYNETSREVSEISEVRNYVDKLDKKFPFWLYFLSKESSALLALFLCLLPPHLTEEEKKEIFPERIDDLLDRWFIALNHVGEFVGMDDDENRAITERTMQYITDGPLRTKGIA